MNAVFPFLGDLVHHLDLAFEFIGALILEYIFDAAVVASFTIEGTTISLAQIVGTVVLTSALVGLQLALAPSVPKPADGHIALHQAIPDRFGAYGTVRIAGRYMLYEATADSFDVLAVISGRIAGFRRFFLHEDIVLVDGSGFVTSAPEFVGDQRYSGLKVTILTRVGLATETTYVPVAGALPSIWTTNHRGDGTASLALICAGVKAEDFQKYYPSGKPEPSAVIDAFYLYDPRDVAQDPDDPATWRAYADWAIGTTYAQNARVLFGGAVYYSRVNGNVGNAPWALSVDNLQIVEDNDHWCPVNRNPVLQWMDFYTNADYGMGGDRAILFTPNIAAIIVQANLCDALRLRKDGNHEPAYHSSSFWTFTNNPDAIVGPILAACDGWTQEAGDGSLVIEVGVYSAPTITLTDRHILGYEVSKGVFDEERVNELTLSFTSPKHKYTQVPGDPWRDDDDISETGRRRSQDLALTNVQSHAQARRLAKRAMARLQAPLYGTLVTKPYGLRILGQRWVTIQLSLYPGLENAVVEIQPDPQIDLVAGTVSFDWRIVNPNSIDAWDPATEEGTEPPVVGANGVVDLPTADHLHAVAGGSPPFHIDLSWDDPQRSDVIWVVRYRLVGGAGDWTPQFFGAPAISGGRISVTIFPTTTADYELQVAAVGTKSTIGDWSPSVFVSTAIPALDFSRAENSIYLGVI